MKTESDRGDAESTTRGPGAPPPLAEDGPAWCVARFGPHAAASLGIDLDGEADQVRRWLLASQLPLERDASAGAPTATLWSALEAGGLLDAPPTPDERGFAPAHALAVESVLRRGGVRRADDIALRIATLAHAVAHRLDGDLDALALRCEGLDELGRALSGLARGLGRGGVVRFLQPLRERWAAAADLPLDRRAVSAGAHLGLWDETVDPEAAAARLASLCDGSPRRRDAEAALARLGAAACARARPARCPLGAHCPRPTGS